MMLIISKSALEGKSFPTYMQNNTQNQSMVYTFCSEGKWYHWYSETYRLLSRELSTISESSISDTISVVESPRSSNSPRFLKVPKANSFELQSAITCFSLASMSFSFTALMQMSCNTFEKVKIGTIHVLRWISSEFSETTEAMVQGSSTNMIILKI